MALSQNTDKLEKLLLLKSLRDTYEKYNKATDKKKTTYGLDLLQKLQNYKYQQEIDKLKQEDVWDKFSQQQTKFKKAVGKIATPLTIKEQQTKKAEAEKKKIATMASKGAQPKPSWSDVIFGKAMYPLEAFGNLWGALYSYPTGTGFYELLKARKARGISAPKTLQEAISWEYGQKNPIIASDIMAALRGAGKGWLYGAQAGKTPGAKELEPGVRSVMDLLFREEELMPMLKAIPKEPVFGEAKPLPAMERYQEKWFQPEDTLMGKMERTFFAPAKTAAATAAGLYNIVGSPRGAAALVVDVLGDPSTYLSFSAKNLFRGASASQKLKVGQALGEAEKAIKVAQFEKPLNVLYKDLVNAITERRNILAKLSKVSADSPDSTKLLKQLFKSELGGEFMAKKIFEKESALRKFPEVLRELRPLAMEYTAKYTKQTPVVTLAGGTILTRGEFENIVGKLAKIPGVQKSIDWIKTSKFGVAVGEVQKHLGVAFNAFYGQKPEIVNMQRIYRAAAGYQAALWETEKLAPIVQKLKDAGVVDLNNYLEGFSTLRQFDFDWGKIPQKLKENPNVKKFLESHKIALDKNKELTPILSSFLDDEAKELRGLEQSLGIDVGEINNYVYQYLQGKGLTSKQIKLLQYSVKPFAPGFEREVPSILSHIAKGDSIKTNVLELAALRREASYKAIFQKTMLYDVGESFGLPAEIAKYMDGYEQLPAKQFKELKGLYLEKDAADTIKAVINIQNKANPITLAGQAFDRLQTIWKMSVTTGIGIPNIYYLARNFMTSGVWNNLWALGTTWFNPELKKLATQVAFSPAGAKLSGKVYVKGLGGEIEISKLNRLVEESGALGLSLSEIELHAAVRRTTEKLGIGRPTVGRLAAGATGVDLFRTVNKYIERYSRAENFIGNLMSGMSPELALLQVKKWHFFYNELSDFERRVLRRAMPFYAWARFNLPLQLKLMIQRPLYSRITTSTKKLAETIAQTEGKEFIPDWMIEQGFIPLPGQTTPEGLPLFMSPSSIPTQELSLFTQPLKYLTSAMTPFAKTPMEMITGKNIFTGAEITKDLIRVPDWMGKEPFKTTLGVVPMEYTDVDGKTKMGYGAPSNKIYLARQIPILRSMMQAFPIEDIPTAEYDISRVMTGITLKPYDRAKEELNFWYDTVDKYEEEYKKLQKMGLIKTSQEEEEEKAALNRALDFAQSQVSFLPENDPYRKWVSANIDMLKEERGFGEAKKSLDILKKGLDIEGKKFSFLPETVAAQEEEVTTQKQQAGMAAYAIEEAKLQGYQTTIDKYTRLRDLAKLAGNKELTNQMDLLISIIKARWSEDLSKLSQTGVPYEGQTFYPETLKSLQIQQEATNKRLTMLKELMGQ